MATTFKETQAFELRAFGHDDLLAMTKETEEERMKRLVPLSEFTPERIHTLSEMTFLEHTACLLYFAFGAPNCVFNVPILLFLVGHFVVGNVWYTFQMFGLLVLLPLTLLPQPFVPKTLQTWMASACAKYFSATIAVEARLDNDQTPRIVVAPPHGFFPYGNFMPIIAWPALFHHHLRGIASTTALRTPIVKQVLVSIGIVDASRANSRQHLEKGDTIGICSGGVAEVFETNANDEVILMKKRKGLIKLAIRAGAEILPGYVFGNTKVMKCWCGEGLPPKGRQLLERVSRRVGVATTFVYGRFGIAIPRRVPIFCVAGTPIPTKHLRCEEPTPEVVDAVQAQLLQEMSTLFHKYKGYYGWQDKKLIIK